MTETGALHFQDLGVGDRPLVFLPGVGGTTRYWASRVAPLAAEHRLRLVDLLGFGQSPKPWLARYTVDHHLAALHPVLNHSALPERFTLIGHSFGAILAVAYAARWPERVRGLVLLSLPHFGGEERAIRYWRRRGTAEGWLLSNAVLAAITCLVTRRVVRRILPRLLPDMPREVVEDLVAHTWRSSTSTVWEESIATMSLETRRASPHNFPCCWFTAMRTPRPPWLASPGWWASCRTGHSGSCRGSIIIPFCTGLANASMPSGRSSNRTPGLLCLARYEVRSTTTSHNSFTCRSSGKGSPICLPHWR